MRVSRAKAIENREIILETASKLFRANGFDGIGLADIMKSAGLTAGGFYKNFESKEDLIAQCCKRTSTLALDRWEEHISNPNISDPLARIEGAYLSEKSRDDLSKSCLFTTVASEVPRHDDEVKAVFKNSLESTIEVLIKIVPGNSAVEKRENAIAMFSQWVGALILARAAGTSTLSNEILESSKKSSKSK